MTPVKVESFETMSMGRLHNHGWTTSPKFFPLDLKSALKIMQVLEAGLRTASTGQSVYVNDIP